MGTFRSMRVLRVRCRHAPRYRKKNSSARRVRACRRRRRLHRALATAHDAAGLRKRSASHAAGLARPRRCRFFFVPLRRVSPRLRSGPSGRSPSACSAESPKNRFFAPARPRQAALLSSVRRRPAMPICSYGLGRLRRRLPCGGGRRGAVRHVAALRRRRVLPRRGRPAGKIPRAFPAAGTDRCDDLQRLSRRLLWLW